MQSARIPLAEDDRLEALHALQLLDSNPTETYDRITRFVAQALDMPIVLVSLVDAHRQWFKSRVGLDAIETARDISFCGHVVFDGKPLIVPDATRDERFAGNPLVTGAPHIRAYIGVPVLTREGHAIGTLCAIDTQARHFGEDDLKQLTDYARILEESIHAQELARTTDDLAKCATEREKLLRDSFDQESERLTREAMSQLTQFHYALDQLASVAITDLDGVIIYANRKFSELSGFTQEELVGDTHRLVKSGVHPPAVFEDLWHTILSGSVWHGELCNRRKSGELYWVDTSIVPYKDHAGRITQYVSIRVEITERKRAQELLIAEEKKSRQINERLRQIADNMPAMIAYWDREGICRFGNRTHFDRFGVAPKQLVGMSIQELFGTTFDTKRTYVEAALRGERQLFDDSVQMPDGALRHWHNDYVPHWQDGQVIGFYALVVDVTHQKRIEADLAQAQKLESIGQLSAGIAHEINTPTQFIGDNLGFLKDSIADIFGCITRVIGLAEASSDGVIAASELARMLKTLDLSFLLNEVPNALEQSVEGIARIQKIVGAMKEFSHPATEKMLLDLNRAISSTITVASNEWKYVADLETDFDETLPLVSVMPGGFNQVILNMIVNAAHAVEEAARAKHLGPVRSKGTITVSTRQVERYAEIRIQDTGCGIPEDVRDRIFDPFFTTKPVGKGTGQGLAIAHDIIVNKHGGVIAVDSQLDLGTTFILRLPLGEETSRDINGT